MDYPFQLTIIYDADCGFCEKIMRWLKNKDTARKLHFIPYQTLHLASRWSQISLEKARRGVQAILLSGKVLQNETAVAACLTQLKGYRWLARIILLPFIRPLAAFFYRFIAAKRKILHFI